MKNKLLKQEKLKEIIFHSVYVNLFWSLHHIINLYFQSIN